RPALIVALSDDRQREAEFRSAALAAFRPDFPADRVDQALAHCEPDTESRRAVARLSRTVERLEQVLRVRPEAPPAIKHPDEDIGIGAIDLDGDRFVRWAVLLRVADEILDNLFEAAHRKCHGPAAIRFVNPEPA